jgi:hypothetical protein
MAVFTVSVSNTAQSTSNDTMTIIGGASRRFRILEVSVSGMAATSASAAAMELGLFLSTGGTTGGGALTPKKWDTNTAVFSGTVNTTWSGQPTLSGLPYVRLAFNAYGGVYRWICPPNKEVAFAGTEQASLRGVVGTANISTHVVIEEV